MTENPLQYQIRRAGFWQFWAFILGAMFVVAFIALLVVAHSARANQVEFIQREAPLALGR